VRLHAFFLGVRRLSLAAHERRFFFLAPAAIICVCWYGVWVDGRCWVMCLVWDFFHVQVHGIGEEKAASPAQNGPAQLIPGQAFMSDGEEGSAAAPDAAHAGGPEDSRRGQHGLQNHGSVSDAPLSVDEGGDESMHSRSALRDNDTPKPREKDAMREISVEEWRRHRAQDLNSGDEGLG